ncbi:hypothetical protein HIM_04086 [Hirsutella minnesotensis 3608]|uniref:FAD-binding domain-containing protein n=1 Tax=Hirsutella minnesotensis 3608 TaxID=1043627 RepID=A0A0F8A1N4_9HYPO|nr:hypothetical protein HIM_04086 [Hirsutella minnesotensis 3608]
MSVDAPRIRIAIVGGGIAGAAVANGLVNTPHLEVRVYESALEFSERGAAVGLSAWAQRALACLIPSSQETLQKAGAVPMSSARIMVGSGPHAGTLVADMNNPEEVGGARSEKIVHRASLLRELLAPLPRNILHANKKLVSIVERGHKREISFEDGTTEIFDAIIGADGLFSVVRKHVLQDAAEKCAAVPAGFWDCRNLVPMARAKAVLGEQYFEQDRQYGWCGDGGFILHDVLEEGTMVQCVMSGIEKESPKDRKQALSRDFLTTAFGSWLDGPIAKGVIDLCLDQDNPHGYSQWEHRTTPTYANGPVCIIGDAAHGTTPWQGAGAGQAFEDAVILATLLEHVFSAGDIEAAFKAYDIIRRPRGQQVIDSSRETGRIMCGQDEGTGSDPSRLGEALATRWEFIRNLDIEVHKREALSKMRELQ